MAAPGVWIHGDLLSGNVLVDGRGRLSAVIDFGCMVVGDPACDVMAAWTLFEAEGREAFRSAIEVDDATWARGRGWALSFALIALPYYMHTNPVFVRDARHVIREVLADQRDVGDIPLADAVPRHLPWRHFDVRDEEVRDDHGAGAGADRGCS